MGEGYDVLLKSRSPGVYLGSDVLSHQTLSDDVDALTVTQDMSPALRVVHQRFDTADQRRVNLRLCALVVHRLQKIQDAR